MAHRFSFMAAWLKVVRIFSTPFAHLVLYGTVTSSRMIFRSVTARAGRKTRCQGFVSSLAQVFSLQILIARCYCFAETISLAGEPPCIFARALFFPFFESLRHSIC